MIELRREALHERTGNLESAVKTEDAAILVVIYAGNGVKR